MTETLRDFDSIVEQVFRSLYLQLRCGNAVVSQHAAFSPPPTALSELNEGDLHAVAEAVSARLGTVNCKVRVTYTTLPKKPDMMAFICSSTADAVV